MKEDLCKTAKSPFCQREFQAVRIQEYACHGERGICVINTCPQPQLALGLSASTKVSQKSPQGCQWECCRSIYGFTRKKNALFCSSSARITRGGVWSWDYSDVKRSFILALFGKSLS